MSRSRIIVQILERGTAMKKVRALALIAALIGYGAASLSSLPVTEAQEKAPQKEAAKAKKAGGRLPANFGQIGLSDEQKEKIYAIQGTYSEQLHDSGSSGCRDQRRFNSGSAESAG